MHGGATGQRMRGVAWRSDLGLLSDTEAPLQGGKVMLCWLVDMMDVVLHISSQILYCADG